MSRGEYTMVVSCDATNCCNTVEIAFDVVIPNGINEEEVAESLRYRRLGAWTVHEGLDFCTKGIDHD